MTEFGDKIRAEYAELVASEPRGMPDDFSPELSVHDHPEQGRNVICYARGTFPDGAKANVSLGFTMTRDPVKDGRLMLALWRSVWQAMELVRLGRLKEVEGLFGLRP